MLLILSFREETEDREEVKSVQWATFFIADAQINPH